jgi:hypothetical protein
MEKAKEIELLQSLKGDTYFAQLFGDEQIDAMCENIRNDYPIEYGLNIFEGSSVAKENTELKKRLASCCEREESVAEGILIKANGHLDDSLEDLAERLIGHKKCLVIKLHSALPLSEEDRDALVKLLAK